MLQCGETEPLKLEAKDHSAAGQTDKHQQGTQTEAKPKMKL
jgi:hypothetical protein